MHLTITQKVTRENPLKICFVCLGNICRSPTAEGIMQHLISERDLQDYFEVDSAGTSAYHIGESANVHSRRVANKNGVKLYSQARRFEPHDLEYFDLILAMDNENLSDLRRINVSASHKKKIMRLRNFDAAPEDKQVPDPYEGGPQGFENVFTIIERSCQNLLDELESNIEN